MNHSSQYKIILLVLFFLSLKKNNAQDIEFHAATIGFYNVENLFDTIVSAGLINGNLNYQDEFYHESIAIDAIPKFDTINCRCQYTEENLKGKQVIRPLILNDEYSPNGPKAWTSQRYGQKIKNLAKVISNIGRGDSQDFPVIVGLAEVENREVVNDLISTDILKEANYGIVHYNSWDARGIDVALIYQKKRFKVIETRKIEVVIFEENGYRDYTRDILFVKGELDGEEIYVLVNHWPSRRGGEELSSPKREKAAEVLKATIDQIKQNNPDAKIIAMGDFNDDPVDLSLKIVTKDPQSKNEMINLMLPMYKQGAGTLAYRDNWNLFDQMIVSKNLKERKYDTYNIYKSGIFNPYYVMTPSGSYKGYPLRTYSGDNYNSLGYSDHFPVYTILIKKAQ